jgi:hypothetical protein
MMRPVIKFIDLHRYEYQLTSTARPDRPTLSLSERRRTLA